MSGSVSVEDRSMRFDGGKIYVSMGGSIYGAASSCKRVDAQDEKLEAFLYTAWIWDSIGKKIDQSDTSTQEIQSTTGRA